MPFVSDSQRRYMFANHPRIAKRWAEHTPKGKPLPESVKTAEPPPPAGVRLADWDKILQQGPEHVLDSIPGGKAEGKAIKNYDRKQLAQGMKVEREHTPDPLKAEEIAADHLEEFPTYYTELDKMETRLKKAAYDSGVHAALQHLTGRR